MGTRSAARRRRRRIRRLQVAGAVALAVVAVVLATWLALRPAARAGDGAAGGSTAAPGASASSAPSASASSGDRSSGDASSGGRTASTGPSSSAVATGVAPASVEVAFVGDALAVVPAVAGAPSTSASATRSTATAGGSSATTGASPAPAQDWAALAAADLRAAGTPITATTAAQAGAGYSAMAAGGLNAAELVPRAVTARTRVVVLLVGAADTREPQSAVLRGARSAVSLARQIAPGATVVLVAPPALGEPVPTSLRRVLAAAAAAEGARFVDPTSAGWSVDAGSVGGSVGGGGGVSLGAAGQQELARDVAGVLGPLVTAAASASSP